MLPLRGLATHILNSSFADLVKLTLSISCSLFLRPWPSRLKWAFVPEDCQALFSLFYHALLLRKRLSWCLGDARQFACSWCALLRLFGSQVDFRARNLQVAVCWACLGLFGLLRCDGLALAMLGLLGSVLLAGISWACFGLCWACLGLLGLPWVCWAALGLLGLPWVCWAGLDVVLRGGARFPGSLSSFMNPA